MNKGNRNNKRFNQHGTPVTPSENRSTMIKRIRTNLSAHDTSLENIKKTVDQSSVDSTILTQLLNLVVEQQKTLNNMFEVLCKEKEPPAETDADLKEKKRSLVIAGLPESIQPLPSKRIEEDRQKIVKLLDALDTEAVPMQVYRLPRNPEYKGTQPRLTKVVLATSYQQRQTLSKASTVKTLPEHQGIFIRPSMNAEERKLDWKLRKAVKMLNEQGLRRVHIKRYELYVGSELYDCDTLKPKNL